MSIFSGITDYLVGVLLGFALTSPLVFTSVTAGDLQQMETRLDYVEVCQQ